MFQRVMSHGFDCVFTVALTTFLSAPTLFAQDIAPSKLAIATADYKLRDLERKVKLADSASFTIGKDGQDAMRRVAELYKSFPDHSEVKMLFERTKVAVRASKGDFVDITLEMLAYRNKAAEYGKIIASASEDRWAELIKVMENDEQAITKPFPTPSPKKVFFGDMENKWVILKNVEYPGLMFTQGRINYTFTGSVSNGYYYLDCSSREFIGAYEALRRAEQNGSLNIPPEWTILGKITDVKTLIPRVGANATGNTAHTGWVVTPVAIYIPDTLLAEYDNNGNDSGSYSGEQVVQANIALTNQLKEAPEAVKPDALIHLFVKSAQERNYDLYLDCIDPDLQETAIQKYYMGWFYNIFVRNVFDNYVTIKVTRQEEIVLLQGQESTGDIEDLFLDDDLKEKLGETAAPKIEQLKIWVQRYNEKGRSVGGVAPVTLRRYQGEDGAKPNRWYIRRGWPF